MSFINNIRPDFNGDPMFYGAYQKSQWLIGSGISIELLKLHNKQIGDLLHRHRCFAKLYDEQVGNMEHEIRTLRAAVAAKEVENKRLKNLIKENK
jgi:hypothetical protein